MLVWPTSPTIDLYKNKSVIENMAKVAMNNPTTSTVIYKKNEIWSSVTDY